MAFRGRTEQGDSELERAIGAWRRSAPAEPGLSEGSRASILREARRARGAAHRFEPLKSLFVPVSRLALGAALPLGALSALLVLVITLPAGLDSIDSPAPSHPRIEATKVGQDVVFVIRNGHRQHTIRQSTDPAGFGVEPEGLTVAGGFQDRLDEDTGIVYYRID